MMSGNKIYALIQWEDLLFNVIDTSTILVPRKEISAYHCGEQIKARYKGKMYSAVICEIDGDKSKLSDILRDEEKMKSLTYLFPGVASESGSVADADGTDADGGGVITSPSIDSTSDNNDKEGADAGCLINMQPVVVKRKLSDDPADSRAQQKKKTLPEKDEAKEAQKERNKIKRVREQDRGKTTSRSFLNEGENSYITIEEDMRTDLAGMKSDIAEMKSQMNTMYEMIESFLQCKNCLRKAYKKLDYKCSVNLCCTSPTSTPNYKASTTPKKPAEQLFSPPVNFPGTEIAPESTDIPELDMTSDSAEKSDLVHVGDEAYGVKIPAADLQRAEKSAKNAIKLGLNLIEFLLSEEEKGNVTLYGNRQHGKEAMSESKRKALRSHIFKRYPSKPGRNEEEWGHIVKSLNDKIRKMKS